jgi:hypothetical protein
MSWVAQGTTLAVVLVAAAGPAQASPIPDGPALGSPPDFVGSPWTPRPVPIADAPPPPRHPRMAPNDRSNIHDDAYQSDTSDGPGPLGRNMRVTSTSYFADCASVTFDTRGRIITICVGISTITLRLLEPGTLQEISSFTLPGRNTPLAQTFTDFSGGGYFYLDHRDRAVLPTTDGRLLVIGLDGNDRFRIERQVSLTGVLPEGDKILSVLPDWTGRLWFATKGGIVGTVNDADKVQALATGEGNGNSFAVDERGGVFIVTNTALYRFDAGASDEPEITWREPYDNIGVTKPGQTQPGSGTTPTLMAGGLVAITDNADPMKVIVYKRAKVVEGSRLVCSQPVFPAGKGSTDNSLIGTAKSLVVENNYGYTGPTSLFGGATEPGVARIDLGAAGGCHIAWMSNERSPTLVPKLSLENGLVYVYTKDPDPTLGDPFYLTALDFRTGRTIFKRRSGNGLGYNNNYAPVTLGADGTAYVGTLGGLVALRDGSATPRVTRPGAPRRPRPVLTLKVAGVRPVRKGTKARCAPGAVRVRIGGRDANTIRQAAFRLDGKLVVRDRRPPFTATVPARRLADGRRHLLRAVAQLPEAARALSVSLRRC